MMCCSMTSSTSQGGAYVTCVMLMRQKIERTTHSRVHHQSWIEVDFTIGFKGVYFEERFLGVKSSLGSWLTSSVITLKPRASSNDTTRGGGESPPSIEECLSLMVLVTSAKLLADKTDNEVGGRPRVPTTWLLPSAEDMEEMEPLELGNERWWGGPMVWPVGGKWYQRSRTY